LNSFFGGFFDPPACHALFTEKVHPARDALVPYAAVLRVYLINLMTLAALTCQFFSIAR